MLDRGVTAADSAPLPKTQDLSDDVERLDVSKLGQMLRARRGALSLRQAAEAAGVSFSTFSRVEAGSQPDLTSFTLLCSWLRVPPSQFFSPVVAREVEPIEQVISHLSADPRLAPDAATKIADVLRVMYSTLAKSQTPTPVIACHLRAASVMRPGVPARMNAILGEMHRKLTDMVAADEL